MRSTRAQTSSFIIQFETIDLKQFIFSTHVSNSVSALSTSWIFNRLMMNTFGQLFDKDLNCCNIGIIILQSFKINMVTVDFRRMSY